MLRRLSVLLLAALVLSACGGGAVEVEEPVSGNDGIQATGRIDGSPVSISRGAPIVIVGDCDPEDGPDEDLCIDARTIDGLSVRLVIENRDALVPGTTVDVVRATCVDGCDTVTDGVVARVELADGAAEVTGGSFEVESAGPRYVADFSIELPFNDRLNGSFDVAERLPEENPSGVLVPEDGLTSGEDG